MYRIESENFMIDIEPIIHEKDLAYPVNTSLRINVMSYGFSAESMLLIDVHDLVDFSNRLKKVYETLSGTAFIKERFGASSFLEFTAGTGGHIKITGNIDNKCAYGYTQMLKFENEIDQTYLKEFAETLYMDYGDVDDLRG